MHKFYFIIRYQYLSSGKDVSLRQANVGIVSHSWAAAMDAIPADAGIKVLSINISDA